MTSRRLTRSVGIVALGRAATAGSILAVNGILARAWTELEVGLFSVVWVLSNTLIPIFLLGIPTSLLYFLPRREASGQPLLLRRSLYCLSGSGALVVALLYFAGPALAKWLEIDGMVQARDMGDLLLLFCPTSSPWLQVALSKEPSSSRADPTGRLGWRSVWRSVW